MMDIAVLRHFLAVARLQSVSKAAVELQLSQPMLSRQILALEKELHTTLFWRTGRRMAVTEEGQRLRSRAEALLALEEDTRRQITRLEEPLSGELSLGCAETAAMRWLAERLTAFQRLHPAVTIRLFSGIATDVLERLGKGQLDAGLLIGAGRLERYHTQLLPASAAWGLLMRSDHPLAARQAIRAEDLLGVPLILNSRTLAESGLSKWFGALAPQLNIAATYTLVYNAALMTQSGVGCTLCLDGLTHTEKDAPLCFRPLTPAIHLACSLIWRRGQTHTPQATAFLQFLQQPQRG